MTYTSIEHALADLKPFEAETLSLPLDTNLGYIMNYIPHIAYEEKDNKLTYAYDVAGIKVKCEEEFENKTKKMYLHFYGECKILNTHRVFNEYIFIDTEIYDKYDWYVSNGILYVILFEKINEKPDFKRVEKVKKVTKEEVNE